MITLDEKLEITKYLESSHSLFRKFWDLGDPVWTDKLPTAGVTFNEDGDLVYFLFNKDFWDALPAYDRAFVVAHEFLHILLEHGRRINSPTDDKEIANKAMDICVNQLLIDSFGFDQSKLTIEKILGVPLCWYDEIFKGSRRVEKNREAEYYYNILRQLATKKIIMKGQLLDSHLTNEERGKLFKKASSFIYEELKNDAKLAGIIKQQNKRLPLNKDFVDALLEQQAGTGSAGKMTELKNQLIKKKRRWESVIPKKDLERYTHDIEDVENFIRRNKRLEFILPDEYLIPSESMMDTIVKKKDKIDLFMFLDNSSSCKSYAQKFFNAYKSLDKRKFNIRLFSFDVIVMELDPTKHEIFGSGGTSFKCIETHIQEILKTEERKKYPYVFVITDGMGDLVIPENPQKWHWFLTTKITTKYIPPKSHIHMLSDFYC
jgi:hypothetical protein